MRYLKLGLILFTIAASSVNVMSQGRPFANPANAAQNTSRAGLMRELGLSVEQIQRIRMINRETGPLKQKAGLNLQQARKVLDQSIYAENVDQNEVNLKIAAVAEAQAAVTKVNALHELRVRQVLTAEQLTKFREIRRSFAERRKRMDAERRRRGTNPRMRRGVQNETDQKRPPNR